MKSLFSPGKLLLTSEYFAMDGALVLAVPTKLGQEFSFEEKDDILQRYGYKGFDSLDADKVIAYHFKNGTAEKMLIEQNSGIQADTFDDVSNMLNAAYNDIYWAINSESIIN